jgi:hypothetical protein
MAFGSGASGLLTHVSGLLSRGPDGAKRLVCHLAAGKSPEPQQRSKASCVR